MTSGGETWVAGTRRLPREDLLSKRGCLSVGGAEPLPFSFCWILMRRSSVVCGKRWRRPLEAGLCSRIPGRSAEMSAALGTAAAPFRL
ncbi:hypothetical protein NDU88_004217 [Pleurodeles waltl]|uniref:Uncharacterized protein n=1 Tax=Pleurodeles waltl TaxID=8319 RepID=A0AAV7WV68_PLEWA|nr:hypothetical protein NDU88_004217 [Pleurodeles waltl]